LRVILSLSRVILSLSRVILSLSKDEHCRGTRRISTMSRYAVIIEKSRTGYGAYVPDLPGCVAAAGTFEETEQLIKEAIEFHIDGMRLEGEPVPAPTTIAEVVEVAAVQAPARP
jgi:predicted RNase H-like HicB family nuclease